LRIQIFDPFSNIWAHAYPVARVMARFSQLGHDLEVVRCNGTFSSHCVSMSASNVDFDSISEKKKLVCRSCRKRSDIIDETKNALRINFEDEIEPADLVTARLFAATAGARNWSSLEFDGIPVGSIASYEIFLTHKIDSIQIPDSVWPEFQANLANTVLVVIIAKRILQKSKPDRVIVYNSLYALNNAYTKVADSLGIPTFTLQGGPHITRRPSTLTCFTSPNELLNSTYSKEGSDWLLYPSSEESISIASEHLQNLLLGQSAFAYSAKSGGHSRGRISKALELDSNKPVLVALLSSEDEFFAAKLVGALPRIDNWRTVFASQNEWISWLIKFAERNPGITLVIRVHPRLMPNKRETKVAPFVRELEVILATLPCNVKVNWPSDEISLYDLMQYTDVVLNRRSSAGLEMMSYGLPVVIPGDEFLFSCPPDICLVAKDTDDYDRLIMKAIEDGWSIENVRKAFRWLGFLFHATTVDVFEASNSRISTIRPKKSQLMIKVWRWLAFIYLHSGLTRSEQSDMLKVSKDLQPLDRLIETVSRNNVGIHVVTQLEDYAGSSVDLETEQLVIDLQFRLSLMRINDSDVTPVMMKFHEALPNL
jgi:hypothetical protein